MKVRQAERADAIEIAFIFNHFIATSHATFEIDPVDDTEIAKRINECRVSGYPFLVCYDEAELMGFAYGKRFKPRPAYVHSVEASVYVRPGNDERGIGTLLYTELLKLLGQSDFHAVIGGISLPNNASVRLHEKFGFEKVAHFREVGRKFDRWIDVGYWELLLHKSPKA
jgi:phosphinothricin acetyltransferase